MRPILFHYASGGLSHFLSLLGNSLTFAKEARWRLAVVSEYHQPLGTLPLDDIFELREPLVPFREISKRKRPVEAEHLRPVRFLDQTQGRMALVRSQNKDQYFSGYLPAFEHRGGFGFSTGDWAPGADRNKKAPDLDSRLTSVKHLALRGQFREAVIERRNLLREPYIGVHFRNTDYTNDIQETITQLVAKVEATGFRDVYWCTDDASSVDRVRTALPDVNLLWNQPFDNSGKNLHYGIRGKDSIKHLKNTFADLYTLFASRDFIPSQRSGWKRFVGILRDEREVAEHFFGLDSTPGIQREQPLQRT